MDAAFEVESIIDAAIHIWLILESDATHHRWISAEEISPSLTMPRLRGMPRLKTQSGKSGKGVTRVLLVEDHPLMRSAVVDLLHGAFGKINPEFVDTGARARSRAVDGRWDLIILDHNLPDARGVDLLPDLVTAGPVLMLTTFADSDLALLARQRGARGYVAKGEAPEMLLGAIRSVLAGGVWFPALTVGTKAQRFSKQEKCVLEGLLEGRSPSDLAKELSVAPTTIQSYKKRLFVKLGVESVAELVRKAVDKGW